MQRTNAQHIIGILNDHLQESYNDSLFDDERFTKSRLYHWVIRTCHELSGSVASNLEHVDKVLNSELNDLIDKAHVHESLGLAHWSKKMKEEINELGRLRAEIQVLREKAQESVSALVLLMFCVRILIKTIQRNAVSIEFPSDSIETYGLLVAWGHCCYGSPLSFTAGRAHTNIDLSCYDVFASEYDRSKFMVFWL
jgi:hypothetical protein